MLGSLAGCSGLDVVAILKKMRVELDDFKINTTASLTDEHPRFYNEVTVEYHFFGQDLDKEKIEKAGIKHVNLKKKSEDLKNKLEKSKD